LEEEQKMIWRNLLNQVKIKLLSTLAIVAILIVAGIIIISENIQTDALENLRSKGKFSVAVMPFQNMNQ